MNAIDKIKDIERKINHIKEVVPKATLKERQEILLRYFSRI